MEILQGIEGIEILGQSAQNSIAGYWIGLFIALVFTVVFGIGTIFAIIEYRQMNKPKIYMLDMCVILGLALLTLICIALVVTAIVGICNPTICYMVNVLDESALPELYQKCQVLSHGEKIYNVIPK